MVGDIWIFCCYGSYGPCGECEIWSMKYEKENRGDSGNTLKKEQMNSDGSIADGPLSMSFGGARMINHILLEAKAATGWFAWFAYSLTVRHF